MFYSNFKNLISRKVYSDNLEQLTYRTKRNLLDRLMGFKTLGEQILKLWCKNYRQRELKF